MHLAVTVNLDPTDQVRVLAMDLRRTIITAKHYQVGMSCDRDTVIRELRVW